MMMFAGCFNYCCCRSCVRLVTSQRSGMGKTLFIQRLEEKLHMNVRSPDKVCVTVPLHGPQVTPDIVMDYLEKHMQALPCTIFHLDIAPNVCVFQSVNNSPTF